MSIVTTRVSVFGTINQLANATPTEKTIYYHHSFDLPDNADETALQRFERFGQYLWTAQWFPEDWTPSEVPSLRDMRLSIARSGTPSMNGYYDNSSVAYSMLGIAFMPFMWVRWGLADTDQHKWDFYEELTKGTSAHLGSFGENIKHMIRSCGPILPSFLWYDL